MTQQEINDFNSKCAEFLGLKRGWWIPQQKPLTEDKKQWWDIDNKTFLGIKVYYDNELQFHSDWNWIMELVKAINMIPNPKDSNDTTLYTYRLTVQSILRSANKEAVVQAINSFLKWYEQNK